MRGVVRGLRPRECPRREFTMPVGVRIKTCVVSAKYEGPRPYSNKGRG